MAIDSEGYLMISFVGGCANYDPDKTKPTKVKSRDVEGGIIYACLNQSGTEEGKRIGCECGRLEWCSKFVDKPHQQFSFPEPIMLSRNHRKDKYLPQKINEN